MHHFFICCGKLCIDFGVEKKSIEVNNRRVFLSVGIHKVGERFGKFQSHRWRREAIEVGYL